MKKGFVCSTRSDNKGGSFTKNILGAFIFNFLISTTLLVQSQHYQQPLPKRTTKIPTLRDEVLHFCKTFLLVKQGKACEKATDASFCEFES